MGKEINILANGIWNLHISLEPWFEHFIKYDIFELWRHRTWCTMGLDRVVLKPDEHSKPRSNVIAGGPSPRKCQTYAWPSKSLARYGTRVKIFLMRSTM